MNQLLAEDEWREKWKQATGGTPEKCPPIFSFDNPTIHLNNQTYLRELGLMAAGSEEATGAWLKLPPYSGDLHRTIERVHARVCQQFQRWMNDSTTERDMDFYCRALAGIFWRTQTPELIHACMWKKKAPHGSPDLWELYECVVDTDGAKAPRPWC